MPRTGPGDGAFFHGRQWQRLHPARPPTGRAPWHRASRSPVWAWNTPASVPHSDGRALCWELLGGGCDGAAAPQPVNSSRSAERTRSRSDAPRRLGEPQQAPIRNGTGRLTPGPRGPNDVALRCPPAGSRPGPAAARAPEPGRSPWHSRAAAAQAAATRCRRSAELLRRCRLDRDGADTPPRSRSAHQQGVPVGGKRGFQRAAAA